MSVSTDGQICYGIILPEGIDYPWDEYDGLDEWWLKESGFVPTFDPYDDEGRERKGVTQGQIDAYFEEMFAWTKAHPCPITRMNYCSANYPEYILTVEDSTLECSRGYPEKIDVSLFSEENAARFGAVLAEFCKKYGIPYEDPGWYLSSYWG